MERIGCSIEQRALEDLPLAEQERDQQPPHAPVAVDERVDGLELGVSEAQCTRTGKEVMSCRNTSRLSSAGCISWTGGGTKAAVLRSWQSGGPDPVLGRAELAGRLVAATDAAKQPGVDLANEPLAQGERPQAVEPVVHGVDVVDDFVHVPGQVSPSFVRLEPEDVLQGALRSLRSAS